MKKNLLVLVLITLLLVACDGASEESTADLPTVVPTIVIAGSEEENAPTDDPPAAEELPVEDDVVEESGEEETAVSSEETSESETMENSSVNLDEIILYEEPQGIDYRTTLEYRMTIGDELIGAANAQGNRTASPDASEIVFTMTGDAAGELGETMIVTQIEDAFYAVLPPQPCITLSGQSGFENPFGLFLDTGGF